MEYKIGGRILSKKNHACGGNLWEIVRVGADIKVKCCRCGRALFLSVDEVKKMTKTYTLGEEINDKSN
ncbi:MAG: DUF951 domain-containing protein [Clostridia bacterium]|nr:DUF951 domain-containing protein [Clostridia bacterium]